MYVNCMELIFMNRLPITKNDRWRFPSFSRQTAAAMQCLHEMLKTGSILKNAQPQGFIKTLCSISGSLAQGRTTLLPFLVISSPLVTMGCS